MRRLISVAMTVFSAMGCGAEAGDSFGNDENDPRVVDVVRVAQMTDEEKALHVLHVAGFSSERIVRDDEGFVVDGDILFTLEDLVARADDAVAKGYWCGRNTFPDVGTLLGCVFEPIQTNMSTGIGLVYYDPDTDTDDGEYNPILRAAFLAAARYWSQAHDGNGHGSEVYIDGQSEHKRGSFFNIEIRMQDLGANGVLAKASWPSLNTFGVYPGRRILINSNLAVSGQIFNTENLTKIAIHELGHTLGFAHPEGADQGAQHISGTSSGVDYPTVMHANYNDVDIAALYYDDARSLVKKYSVWENDLPATPQAGFCEESYGAQMRNGCDVGEGDCDGIGTNAQCKDNLECANNVGERWELPSSYDVCEKPSSCPAFAESASSSYCDDIECPCGPWEGDCELDSQCGGRLICGTNLGLAVGKPASWDICILPRIPGCPTFDKSEIASYAEFCSTSCPCNLGEGDCDSDDECRGDLKCRTAGVALGYGSAYSSWDFCVSDTF